MPITRETDGEAAEAVMAGRAAFWAGEPLLTDKGGDWVGGWLAAAAEARAKAGADDPLVAQRARVVSALREAYAALRNVVDVTRLTPGNRNRCRAALEEVGVLLAYLEQDGSARRHLRRGRA